MSATRRSRALVVVMAAMSTVGCCHGFFFSFAAIDLCQELCRCSQHPTLFMEQGMDCSYANLTQLPSDLKLPTGTTRADFSRNNITYLSSSTFSQPSPSLQFLDLSDNRLEGLEGGGFVGLGNLKELLLTNNVLKELDEEAFQGLGNLTKLDLSYNQLVTLPESVLAHLTQLEHLNLGFNSVPYLNSTLLASLTRLQHLDLSHLGIHTIGYGFFHDNLTRLEWLSLSHNLITVVPTSAITHLAPTLTHFDLSGNPITSLGAYSFSELVNLRTLVLEQMLKLRTIEPYAFGDLWGLDTVVLRYMPRIESIDPKAFYSLTKEGDSPLTLEDFTFSFSVLTTLPSTLLPWASLKFVSLEYNHWTCDCNMLWVKNSSLANMVEDRMVCSRPLRLRGHRLRRVPDEDFTCGTEPPLSNEGTVGFLVVVMITGLGVSLATVSLLVYYRRGWVCRRPQGAYRHIQRGSSVITIEEDLNPANP